MGFLKPKSVPAPVVVNSADDPIVQARADEQRRMAAKAKGRQSTIVTGALGIGNTSGNVASKKLLGG